MPPSCLRTPKSDYLQLLTDGLVMLIFQKKHEAIHEGEKAALEALPQIMQIISQLRQEGRLEWRNPRQVK